MAALFVLAGSLVVTGCATDSPEAATPPTFGSRSWATPTASPDLSPTLAAPPVGPSAVLRPSSGPGGPLDCAYLEHQIDSLVQQAQEHRQISDELPGGPSKSTVDQQIQQLFQQRDKLQRTYDGFC